MVVGSAILVTGDDRGRPHLDRCLALAREKGLSALVALAYLNIGSSYGEQYRFAEAERELAEGIAFARNRDLDHVSALHERVGGADAALSGALGRGRRPRHRGDRRAEPGRRQQDHGARGSRPRAGEAWRSRRRSSTRRGAGARLATETLQRLAPVRAARAELAWLAGDRERTGDRGSRRLRSGPAASPSLACRRALVLARRWQTIGVVVPKWAARPFALQIAGSWKRAAAEWSRLGCPYEEARALAEGDVPAQMRALEVFDRLGAAPAAALLRQRTARGRRQPHPARTPRQHAQEPVRPDRARARDAGRRSRRASATAASAPSSTSPPRPSIIMFRQCWRKLGAASRQEAARIAREQRLVAQDGEGAVAK